MRQKMLRSFIAVALVGLCAALFACTGNMQRNLYADVEIGLKAGYQLIDDLSNQELKARAAGKPDGSIITRAQGENALDTLDAAKAAARLAVDTTSGCVQAINPESAKALERLGLAGCVTSDQVLIAALAVTRRLRESMEVSP